MAKSQALQLNPQTELAFDGPFTEVVTSYLSLTNPTDQTIYFKVKTTAPRYYCVRPNSGIIQPDGTAKISVMLQPVDQPSALDKDRTRHKFMIQAAYAKNDSQAPDEFWKSVDSSEIMDSKLKVVFNNLNINGAGSDAHSGTRSPDSGVYHDDLAQSDQHAQRRNVQQTSHENRKSSPTESDSTFQKERARIEEENRGLTMQVQELRVVLISLAVFLLGIILGKLF